MLEDSTLNFALFAAIVTAVVSLIPVLLRLLIKKELRGEERPLPGERMQQSILKLSSASQEIDAIIQDIVRDIKQRQTMQEELKASYQTQLSEEAELSKRVEMLKDVPLEAAEYFNQINRQTIGQMEEKRLKRDILMFISGIIATTVITMLLAYGLG